MTEVTSCEEGDYDQKSISHLLFDIDEYINIYVLF